MSGSMDVDQLRDLALCLARPVQHGWLSLAVAEAALVLAVCDRHDLVGDAVTDLCAAVHDELHRAVAA